MTEIHEGACFCGEIKLEVTGPAVAQGFCHCDSCRKWSATPVTAYVLFPQTNVRITGGGDHIGSFDRDGKARRVHCKKCGGAVMTEIPAAGLVDVYAPTIPGFKFTPEAHVHYAKRIIDMADGLPKFKDMPEQAGGSGAMIED